MRWVTEWSRFQVDTRTTLPSRAGARAYLNGEDRVLDIVHTVSVFALPSLHALSVAVLEQDRVAVSVSIRPLPMLADFGEMRRRFRFQFRSRDVWLDFDTATESYQPKKTTKH